jgi:Family of unknown function (DUF5367)
LVLVAARASGTHFSNLIFTSLQILGVKNMAQMTQVRQPSHPISLIILGITFWFEALLFIRFGGQSLFVNGNPWLLLLFVCSIPVAWLLVKVIAVVGKVDGNDLLRAVVIVALTAMLLDGIALTWCPDWYSLAPAGLLLAAAWLLWGVGVSFALALALF